MWLKDNTNHEGKRHEDFVYDGLVGTQMSFTAAQMAVLTFACGYPDKADSGLHDMDDNPYHGFLWQRAKEKDKNGNRILLGNSNYIANYIFLTKVAKAFGDAVSVPKGTMFQNDYDRILEDITTTRLGTRTWAEQSGVWKRVSHHSKNWEEDADNPSVVPLRYKAAQRVVQSALAKACYSSEGLLADFILPSSYFGNSEDEKFYLGNYSPYAEKVNSIIYDSGASAFNSGDLDKNVSYYNFEGNTYYIS